MHCIKFHIKTLKIALTCFDPKIILRELRCSFIHKMHGEFLVYWTVHHLDS